MVDRNGYQTSDQDSVASRTVDFIDGSVLPETGANLQLELKRLLKCNYTGIVNLYLCNN